MKEMKRLFALILCLAMVCTMLPAQALAEVLDTEETVATQLQETEAAETDPVETDPVETDPVETDPAETEPQETDPEATDPAQDEPVEGDEPGAEDETLPEETEDPDAELDTAAEVDDGIIYVLAGGDFQEAGNHTESAQNVRDILTQIKGTYGRMDGFIFIGDYDNETHGDPTETAAGIAALMGAVQGTYSNIDHDNSILVQGNHDAANGNLDNGGHLFDGYAVYTMHEDGNATDEAYPEKGADENRVKTLAASLESWLNERIAESYTKPIFIASHLPLVYSARTSVNHDGIYANYIVDVLNKAAESGLNIIFLHGHNHAWGYDSYLGGNAIYLPEGSEALIPALGDNSLSNATKTKLNFTYLNAGYVGYYSNTYNSEAQSSGTDLLTMTVFAIEGEKVTVQRYSHAGLYNLKDKGNTLGTYTASSGLDDYLNTDVVGPTATILLDETVTGDTSTGGNPTPPSIGSNSGSNSGSGSTATGWVLVQSSSDASGYQYELDTDGIDRGEENEYIIVARNEAKVLNATNTSGGTVEDATINGTTAIVDSRAYEYYFTTGNLVTRDGSNTLYQQNWVIRYGNLSGSNLDGFTHYGNGYYRIYDTDGTARSLYYDGSKFNVTSDNHTDTQYSVRLYKYVGELTGTDEYARLEIDDSTPTDFNPGTTQAEVEDVLKQHMRVYTSTTSEDEGTLIDDAAVTWSWDGGFNAAGYSTFVASYKGKELGRITIHVAVEPGEGTNEGWVLIDAGDTTYTYTLDTDGVDAGENYLIVAPSAAYALTHSVGSQSVTISGSTITTTTRDYEWTFSGSSSGTISSGNTYLGRTDQNALTNNPNRSRTWTISSQGNGSYRLSINSRYLRYNNSSFSLNSDTNTVRLYRYTGTQSTSALYAKMDGTLAHTIGANTMTQAQIEELVKADITAATSSNSDGSGTTADIKNDLVFSGIDAIDPAKEGNYTVTVTYDGKTLGTVNVCVQARMIESVELPSEGWIDQYSLGTTYVTDKDGKTLMATVEYEGEEAIQVPVTLNLLRNLQGDYVNVRKAGDQEVSMTYGQATSGNNMVLHVRGVYVNNYPEYPNEGAVKVNKTATGIDFQTTGIAQVELSASGVPSKKGADVIVMLDTSSSMNRENVDEDGDGVREDSEPERYEVLNQTMDNLITQLQTNGPDGNPLDIRIAIGDFNGFYGQEHDESGTPYDRDANDRTTDAAYTADSYARVFTGNRQLNAGAFVQATNYNWVDLTTNDLHSGTNYDYAFDAIYQMGAAIKRQNRANGEDRDLFVIFMSDGAAMQWNYYHSQGASQTWEHWITGDQRASYWNDSNLNCAEHLYYFDDFDHDGDGYVNEHRMANAIKGDPNQYYTVIRKSTDGLEDINPDRSGEDNMYTVPGLGATMWSISFDATTDTNVEAEHMIRSIASLASHPRYAYNVASSQALGMAFVAIGNEIAYAASNARFVDQMGENFNLQLALPKGPEGNVIQGITPTIEVLTYDIWTRQEYLDAQETATTADDIELDQIGTRKGTYTVEEVVMFSEDGTRAYSSLIDADKDGTPGVTVTKNADGTYSYAIGDTDDYCLSLTDAPDGADFDYKAGVIYARNFMYNTTGAPVTAVIDGISITIEPESFYWNLNTIQTTEKALRYYVYLDGSMEGQREAGSYATNEYATLYYTNHLGNDAHMDTVSPSVAWESANVSYAFYLVDQNGNVLVNQTSGYTGSFANRIVVTNPVVFDEVLLNNEDVVRAINVADVANTILPDGYTLYDANASYHVRIGSGSHASDWTITYDSEKVQSTYVTGYSQENAAAFTNDTMVTTKADDEQYMANADLTHTTVWFAVVWSRQALPDTVVIDYGLPVDISVLVNDMFGDGGELHGVAAYQDSHQTLIDSTIGHGGPMAEEFGETAHGIYGTATADYATGKIRYQLNSMAMDGFDKFTYAVEYTGTDKTLSYYYDTVTVIPATTIYYEDSFVELSVYDNASKEKIPDASWETAGTTVDTTQGEDRPGQYSLSAADKNNLYGYDGAYTAMTEYSLGSARKITVNAERFGIAEFSFTGTGFDVISMTSNTTGTITVKVTGADGFKKTFLVDTYYGYSYNEETGEWVVNKDAANSLYQIPVMKVDGLAYGDYDVRITAAFSDAFDNTGAKMYYFYLDAIRIYDPANDGAVDTTGTITGAYVQDNEGWPEYHELRNKLIDANTFKDEESGANVTGLVYIDGGTASDANIGDYTSYGPNNEVYLTAKNALAFRLDLSKYTVDGESILADVQIGVKSADGKPITVKIWNLVPNDKGEYVAANIGERTLATSTDMYYSLKRQVPGNNALILIQNTGTSGIASITNIKLTFTENPAGGTTAEEATPMMASFSISPYEADLAVASVMSLSLDEEPDVEIPTEPEVPETTVPEETQPQETEPVETQPEETQPEETQPEPETPGQQVEAAIKNFVNKVASALKNFFGRWF